MNNLQDLRERYAKGNTVSRYGIKCLYSVPDVKARALKAVISLDTPIVADFYRKRDKKNSGYRQVLRADDMQDVMLNLNARISHAKNELKPNLPLFKALNEFGSEEQYQRALKLREVITTFLLEFNESIQELDKFTSKIERGQK